MIQYLAQHRRPEQGTALHDADYHAAAREPVGRTETKIFTIMKRRIGAPQPRALYDGKRWYELTEDQHQRFPGDYEAQVGQGAITLHSEVGKGCRFRTTLPAAGRE